MPSYKLFIVASLTGLAYSVALPAPVPVPQGSVQTVPTPDWKAPGGGNIMIGFSDGRIPYGGVNPLDIVKSLYDECYDVGTCSSIPKSRDGSYVNGRIEMVHLETTIGTGYYPPWVKNGLVEILTEAVKQVTQEKQVTPPLFCPVAGSYCPPSQPLTQFTAPAGWEIVYTSADGKAPLAVISVGTTADFEGDEGVCKTFADVGAALLGAVNGFAGAGLTLAGLFCQR